MVELMSPLMIGLGALGVLTEGDLLGADIAQTGAAGILGAGAIIMFRYLMSQVSETRAENRQVEQRCRDEIRQAVEVAVAEERRRAAATERSLTHQLDRLRRGLKMMAETVTDEDALRGVLDLLASSDDPSPPASAG